MMRTLVPVIAVMTVFATSLFAQTSGSSSASGQRLQETPSPQKPLINDVEVTQVRTHPLTPYLETTTLAVLDVDLAQLDVSAALRWIESLAEQDGDEVAETAVKGWIETLRGNGVRHVYLTASTRSAIDGWPLIVIPCEDPAGVGQLAQQLIGGIPGGAAVEVRADAERYVLIGPASTIERVLQPNVAGRAELMSPLQTDSRDPVLAVISIPDEARRELAALWPDSVPETFPVPASPNQLVRDIRRVLISLRLAAQPTVRVEIESVDAAATARVEALARKCLELPKVKELSIQSETVAHTVSLSADPQSFQQMITILAAPARNRSHRRASMQALKKIGLAMHAYHDKHEQFPPRSITDSAGKPLLSWRVALLPFLDQQALYEKFRLDERWDSEANAFVSGIMVPTFADPGNVSTKTRIRVPSFPGSLWVPEGAPKSFRDVTDGTSSTIAAIEAPSAEAVDWANPEYWGLWILKPDDPVGSVFGDSDSVLALFLDGSVRELRRDETTTEQLRAMLTIAGGEAVDGP